VAGAIFIWGVLVLAGARLRRSRIDSEVALWNILCRRLARAGLTRAPEEGPLAYTRRAASRWPQSAAELERIGQRYAQLHYGARDSRYEQFLEELKKGIKSLPATRALNRGVRSTSASSDAKRPKS
jgi:protein-glutamine gamma-glutamyltransferase